MRVSFCLPAVLIIAVASALHAQEIRGSISGAVTDSTGAAVAGAKVVATDTATNASSETVTNEAGRYSLLFLRPSGYQLTVEASGFKKFVREDVALGTSERLGIDVVMEVGQLVESVTVTGALMAVPSLA